MAHSLSAKKRARQDMKRRARNRASKGAVKTQIRRFLDVANVGGDMEAITNQFKLAQKKIDKLAAKGIMHKNTASRRKALLASRLNALRAGA